MKQTKLLILATAIAAVGFGCHPPHQTSHYRGYDAHEPAGAVVGPHHESYGHYDEHGVGRQNHRHYYRNRH